NLRSALEWRVIWPDDAETGLKLSGALAWFWHARSYLTEGRRWVGRALAGATARSAARMKALAGAGLMAQFPRDPAASRACLEESLAIARERDDRWWIAWALHLLGRVAYYEGDAATARSLGEQCLTVARERGDGWL